MKENHQNHYKNKKRKKLQYKIFTYTIFNKYICNQNKDNEI